MRWFDMFGNKTERDFGRLCDMLYSTSDTRNQVTIIDRDVWDKWLEAYKEMEHADILDNSRDRIEAVR